LIAFTQKLKQIIPEHILTHSPQAPYFSSTKYKNGGYVNINQQVGNLIDFYNVQFYNQGNTSYDTY
jgi:chitinase